MARLSGVVSDAFAHISTISAFLIDSIVKLVSALHSSFGHLKEKVKLNP